MSSGDGALTTNNEGALWRLIPHGPARLVSGLLKLECFLEARTDSHPLVAEDPFPLRPYTFSGTTGAILVCNMPNDHSV